MPDENNEQEPQLFTPEQTQMLMNLINRGTAAAVKQHSGKLEKQFSTFSDEIRTVIQAARETIPADNGGNKVDPAIAQQLDALRKQNEAVQAALKAERDEKEAMRASQRENEARGELTRLIRAAGVTNDDLLAGASEVLYKRVARTEDGSLVMKLKRDGLDEELPLDKAIGEWAKGQGKSFLPPSQAKGSGQQRVSNGSNGANPTDVYVQNRDRALTSILDAVSGTGLTPVG